MLYYVRCVRHQRFLIAGTFSGKLIVTPRAVSLDNRKDRECLKAPGVPVAYKPVRRQQLGCRSPPLPKGMIALRLGTYCSRAVPWAMPGYVWGPRTEGSRDELAPAGLYRRRSYDLCGSCTCRGISGCVSDSAKSRRRSWRYQEVSYSIA